MRTVLTLLVVAAIAVGGWLFYKMKNAEPVNHFRTETAKLGDVTSTISATGTVEPVNYLDVGAQVQGRIIDFGIDPAALKGRKLEDIPAEEKAKLKRLDFNSIVHPGTILAYIDPAVYNAQYLQAEATLNHNIADLIELKAKAEQAAADWNRAKRLRPDLAALETDDPAVVGVSGLSDDGTVSKAPIPANPEKKSAAAPPVLPQPAPPSGIAEAKGTPGNIEYLAMSVSDYDLAKANYKVALANVLVGEKTIDQSKAARDLAKTNLDYCTISSPIEGTIIDRRVNIGQTVVSGLNVPSIFLIDKDLTTMQVWALVNEADIGKIRNRPSMRVRFTIDTYPGETFYGNVTQVRLNAQQTQQVVLYTVVVTFDNSQLRLFPYLTANLQFEVEEHDNVLLVPNVALRWAPRKEQIAPDVRDSVWAALQGKSSGTKTGKGGGKEAAAPGQDGKAASPGQDGAPQPPAANVAAKGAPSSASPGADAKSAESAKPAAASVARPERGRIWVQDGNYVRPINVRIGVTDAMNTEVTEHAAGGAAGRRDGSGRRRDPRRPGRGRCG